MIIANGKPVYIKYIKDSDPHDASPEITVAIARDPDDMVVIGMTVCSMDEMPSKESGRNRAIERLYHNPVDIRSEANYTISKQDRRFLEDVVGAKLRFLFNDKNDLLRSIKFKSVVRIEYDKLPEHIKRTFEKYEASVKNATVCSFCSQTNGKVNVKACYDCEHPSVYVDNKKKVKAEA